MAIIIRAPNQLDFDSARPMNYIETPLYDSASGQWNIDKFFQGFEGAILKKREVDGRIDQSWQYDFTRQKVLVDVVKGPKNLEVDVQGNEKEARLVADIIYRATFCTPK